MSDTTLEGLRKLVMVDIKAICDVAEKHGWNGVENSKIVWQFFDDALTANSATIARLEQERDEWKDAATPQIQTISALQSEVSVLRGREAELKTQMASVTEIAAKEIGDLRQRLEQEKADQQREIERLKERSYAHMCRDGHVQIGHNDSESEMCPLCREIVAGGAVEEKLAERVAELEAALREWNHHSITCRSNRIASDHPACDCGLSQARALLPTPGAE